MTTLEGRDILVCCFANDAYNKFCVFDLLSIQTLFGLYCVFSENIDYCCYNYVLYPTICYVLQVDVYALGVVILTMMTLYRPREDVNYLRRLTRARKICSGNRSVFLFCLLYH